MKIRKLLAATMLAGALVASAAVGAAAAPYEPAPAGPGCTQGTVFELGTSIPCGAPNVPAGINYGLVDINGTGGTTNPSNNTITTAASVLLQVPASRQLTFSFTPPAVGNYTIRVLAADAAGNLILQAGQPIELCASAIRVVLPATGGGGGGTGHPATGAETALYAVGGLLLVTAGVALVASNRRRKTHSV